MRPAPALVVTRPHPAVQVLVLNRPNSANSLDRDTGEILLDAFRGLPDDRSVRAVVLTGTDPAFCAGDDIATIERHLDGDHTDCPVLGNTDDPIYTRVIEAMLEAPVPVIAAVNGSCAGAGTELACAADLRLASNRARIGSCLLRVAQVGTAVMLPRVVGEAKATELYLSSRLVCAEEALRIGLVHEVHPHATLIDRATELAVELAGMPTKAIGVYKELRERAATAPVREALRLQNAAHIRTNRVVADATEGARAFVEHRPPRFTGE